MSLVAETLQCSDSSHTDRCCLFKCDVGRLQRDRAIGARANILCKRTGAPAEDFITRLELSGSCRIFADSFNCSCIIDAQSRVLWFAQPTPHQPHEPHSSHEMS